MKGDGGYLGLTENHAALQRWVASDPELVREIGKVIQHPAFAQYAKSLTVLLKDMESDDSIVPSPLSRVRPS